MGTDRLGPDKRPSRTEEMTLVAVKNKRFPFFEELEAHLWRSNRESTPSMSNSLFVWARGLGKVQQH